MKSGRESRNSASSEKASILKVVLLGNGHVGKSSLMNRFVHNTFDEKYTCTLGVDFLNKEVEVDGRKYCFQIWDTAGQERFKGLRTPFYRGSDICILTYGINDRSTFTNLSNWKGEFIRYARLQSTETFPFIVIGNKSDLPEEERQVTTEEAEMWCQHQGYPFIETSAKECINVENAFHLALHIWLENEAKMPKIHVGETVELSSVKSTSSTCC